MLHISIQIHVCSNELDSTEKPSYEEGSVKEDKEKVDNTYFPETMMTDDDGWNSDNLDPMEGASTSEIFNTANNAVTQTTYLFFMICLAR